MSYTKEQFYMACELLIGTEQYEINKVIPYFNIPNWCDYISRLYLLEELNDEPEALEIIRSTARNLWRSNDGTHNLK